MGATGQPHIDGGVAVRFTPLNETPEIGKRQPVVFLGPFVLYTPFEHSKYTFSDELASPCVRRHAQGA